MGLDRLEFLNRALPAVIFCLASLELGSIAHMYSGKLMLQALRCLLREGWCVDPVLVQEEMLYLDEVLGWRGCE